MVKVVTGLFDNLPDGVAEVRLLRQALPLRASNLPYLISWLLLPGSAPALMAAAVTTKSKLLRPASQLPASALRVRLETSASTPSVLDL